MANKQIRLSWGPTFTAAAPWAGALLLIFGIYTIYDGLWLIGGIISVFAFLFAVLNDGVLIDPQNKRIKTYWGLLGLRFGEWKSMEKYKYLVLLRAESKISDEYGDDDFSVSSSEKVVEYHLFLVSANHLKRTLLASFDFRRDALEAARDLSDDLKLDFVKYNPGQIVHQKRH